MRQHKDLQALQRCKKQNLRGSKVNGAPPGAQWPGGPGPTQGSPEAVGSRYSEIASQPFAEILFHYSYHQIYQESNKLFSNFSGYIKKREEGGGGGD